MGWTRAEEQRGFGGVAPESAAGLPGGPPWCVTGRWMQLVIEGLPLTLRLGWTKPERALAQTIWIDVLLFVAYDGSGELSGTVDLDEAVATIRTLSGHEYRLVEDLAERLAHLLLQRFSKLMGVRVMVKKPNPPVGVPVAALGVVVERRRDG